MMLNSTDKTGKYRYIPKGDGIWYYAVTSYRFQHPYGCRGHLNFARSFYSKWKGYNELMELARER